jgi:putative redox protein
MGKHAGSISVRHLGGDRLELSVRGHVLMSDQPVEDGGTDTAPTPTELFVGSLAGCVAFYAERFLRRRGLEGGLVVTAGYTWASEPSRVGAIDVRIDAPQLPAELLDAFRRVVESCPVHNTLVAQPAVRFQISKATTEAA